METEIDLSNRRPYVFVYAILRTAVLRSLAAQSFHWKVHPHGVNSDTLASFIVWLARACQGCVIAWLMLFFGLLDCFFDCFTDFAGVLLNSTLQFLGLAFGALELVVREFGLFLFQLTLDDVKVALDFEFGHTFCDWY